MQTARPNPRPRARGVRFWARSPAATEVTAIDGSRIEIRMILYRNAYTSGILYVSLIMIVSAWIHLARARCN
jgi:hypothetical protein